MPESKPRTRWLGQQVETDSEDEGDDIEVFWETTSIMSGVPTISPNKMATPRRTTPTTSSTTARATNVVGQKRPANASPPPPHSASSTTMAKTTSASAAAAAASLARRRKKRAGEGCDVPIGQAVDSKTLKMVGQLAIKFSTRPSSSLSGSRQSHASTSLVGSKKNHSAPHLPLRDRTGSTVNADSARTATKTMVTEGKGKTVVRAATAPSGTLTATLDEQVRTARRSPPSIPAAGIASRTHTSWHASSSKAIVPGTSSQNTNAVTTSAARVEPMEESRPKSDDFDDLFGGDDSFEHILSQYDEDSLISNATTIISSQLIGVTACKNDQKRLAVPQAIDQKRAERILQGAEAQPTTKVSNSPLPMAPSTSITCPVVPARGASPRRNARAAVSRTTKATAAPVTRLMTTTTLTKQEHPTAASTKTPARAAPLQRTASSSSCSQAEAQERLQQELQSLAEQDVNFWSEEGDEV
ncbi:BQ2448_2497 [Microbotryum intermedium]|uniref:BQ2448_2497 protein n=1 Tax=Microbotryum intermedium TaxID=269621 RepID=A0A238F8L0_9BASI|nr:BQ2448_2497 [Microbotryum intermedium]